MLRHVPYAGIIPVLISTVFTLFIGCSTHQPNSASNLAAPDTIRVFIAAYYPTLGEDIDLAITGDWGRSLDFTRAKVDSVTTRVIEALEEGSRMHGYKNESAPKSLIYKIMGKQEFLEPLPTFSRAGSAHPMTDYARIFQQVEGESWVSKQGVDEVWVWGYHGGVIDLWESNMSSPHGDVSNSDRVTEDLPILDRTYTVYHYNYQRGAAEAVENHMHQFEAILNSFDGRDDTPAAEWPSLLFWGQFVGSDSTHQLLSPRRAGWSHYPPNAEKDYQWDNTLTVQSDIENWTPDGKGPFQEIECSRWRCDHLGWFVYWMQNMPGRNNTVLFGQHPMRNWWTFLSEYDEARDQNWKLWMED